MKSIHLSVNTPMWTVVMVFSHTVQINFMETNTGIRRMIFKKNYNNIDNINNIELTLLTIENNHHTYFSI